MERGEFEKAYLVIVEQAEEWSVISRRDGLLGLEDRLNEAKLAERDIFHFGMTIAIDGSDEPILNKILSNIIAQETDEEKKLLKIVQKEAVLGIKYGMNPRLLAVLLGSYVDNKLANTARENRLNKEAREESNE